MQSLRARDLGIPFEGKPGKFNAITDVRGRGRIHNLIEEAKTGKPEVGKGQLEPV